MDDVKMIEVGAEGSASVVVDNSNTAKARKSGSLDVFATPEMIRLVEEASCNALEPYLSEQQSSVGFIVDVKHVAPSIVGLKVTAKVKVTEVKKNTKITFECEVNDDNGLVGKGTHVRVIIDQNDFMTKAQTRSKA